MYDKNFKMNLDVYSTKGDGGYDFHYGLSIINVKSKCAFTFFEKKGLELALNSEDFRKNRLSFEYKTDNNYKQYQIYFDWYDKFFFEDLYFIQVLLHSENKLIAEDFLTYFVENQEQVEIDGFLTGFISASKADKIKKPASTTDYKNAKWVIADIKNSTQFGSLEQTFLFLDGEEFSVCDVHGEKKSITNKDILTKKTRVILPNCLTEAKTEKGTEQEIKLILTPMDFTKDILWVTNYKNKLTTVTKKDLLFYVKEIRQKINGDWTEWMPIESVFFLYYNATYN